MKPRDKIDRHANLSEISAQIKYDPLWKSQHLISLNLKQLCLMIYLVKVFCSVQYDPRRKSQHLVSLDLKPLVLMFYPMIVFCSELSLHSRLCSAVAISNETCLSHQSLVCPFPRKQRNEQESKKQCKPEQELTNESFKFQKNSHTGRFIDPKRATNR